MSPTAEEGGRAASSMPRQRWDPSSFPLATTPRFRASGADLQVEGERTAYAHGCAQRAGGTTQRRHEAAPGLSPDPRKFRSQFLVARRSAPRAAARNLVYPINPAARRKASSVHVHVTAARPEPAGLSSFAKELRN